MPSFLPIDRTTNQRSTSSYAPMTPLSTAPERTGMARVSRRLVPSCRLADVRRTLAEESGTAVVEFALVGVVFFVLLFGVTQFGLALNSANDETHLANEVARYAAV